MHWNDYVKESEKTLSLNFYSDKEKERTLKATIDQLMEKGEILDKLKKSIFYGTENDFSQYDQSEEGENFEAGDQNRKNLLHFLIGKVTENIELLEILDKVYFKGEKLDEANLKEELGDDAWYSAGIYREQGYDLEEILDINIEKLHKKRYKKGKFSQEEAENRDLKSERETLEKGLNKK